MRLHLGLYDKTSDSRGMGATVNKINVYHPLSSGGIGCVHQSVCDISPDWMGGGVWAVGVVGGIPAIPVPGVYLRF